MRGETRHPGGAARRWIAAVQLVAAAAPLAACSPAPQSVQTPTATSEWREFEGVWTAAGTRETILLGAGRKASIANLKGTLLLTGATRPAAGVRADVVVFNDSETGMIGRAVWTDERGDQAFSELRGEGTATGNRIVGTFLGGTGRFAGLTGEYSFSWRFVLENEDGTVQGQSLGLKGRARATGAPIEGKKP